MVRPACSRPFFRISGCNNRLGACVTRRGEDSCPRGSCATFALLAAKQCSRTAPSRLPRAGRACNQCRVACASTRPTQRSAPFAACFGCLLRHSIDLDCCTMYNAYGDNSQLDPTTPASKRQKAPDSLTRNCCGVRPQEGKYRGAHNYKSVLTDCCSTTYLYIYSRKAAMGGVGHISVRE